MADIGTVFGVFIFVQGALGFQWSSSSTLPDGTTIQACKGENVTFPWTFTLEDSEHVHDTEWLFSPLGMGGNVIATAIQGNFIVIPAISQQVTFLPNAGLTLHDVTLDEAGTYTVEVAVLDQGSSVYHTMSVILEVFDPPTTTGDELHAHLLPGAIFHSDTGQWHAQIACSTFLTFGQPPVSVVWKTPTGAVLPSTSQDNGTFTFNLPNPVQHGQYICQLNDSAVLQACFQSNSSFHDGASVNVNAMVVTMVVMEAELLTLRPQNQQCQSSLLDLQAENDRLQLLNSNYSAQHESCQPSDSGKTPRDCRDVQLSTPVDGVYTIYPAPGVSMRVYCDQTTNGGGWTVIQRRIDGSVDFYRNWTDYENGFGDLQGEFWLGLSNLYELTSQQDYSLRIDMEMFNGSTGYAQYSRFSIGPATDYYRLNVTGYTSNTSYDSLGMDNFQQFSTYDSDHDSWPGHCAVDNHGGWWYAYCGYSNLNGRYKGDGSLGYDGIVWLDLGFDFSLKGASMKIRPAVQSQPIATTAV